MVTSLSGLLHVPLSPMGELQLVGDGGLEITIPRILHHLATVIYNLEEKAAIKTTCT